MGLMVEPIPNINYRERIEALIVSTDFVDVSALFLGAAAKPEGAAEGSCTVASAGVISPVKGANVRLSVEAPESGRTNVVNLPAVVG